MRRALTVAACVAAAGLSSCGQSDPAELQQAKEEGAAQQRLLDQQRELQDKVSTLERKKGGEQSTKTVTVTVGGAPSSEPSPGSSAGGSWPAGTSAWTVILASAGDHSSAENVAARALAAGLEGVGVLNSSDHSSLRAGYWVAYTGVLGKDDAARRQGEARAAGFSDAYARFVSAS